MLYLIATPIGNLSDITLRALDVLRSVSYILCEDTRISRVLCHKHQIFPPLKSFHQFSERESEERVIADLKEGKEIALISDAGTPTVSDPGWHLITRCQKEEIPYTFLPGPSAPIAALVLSGLKGDRFQFRGFLSKKDSERKIELLDAFYYPGVTIFFESPNRIEETLKEIDQMSKGQQIAVVREISKIYEEVLKGTAEEILKTAIRGEIVLLIEGGKKHQVDLSPKEQALQLQKEFDLSKQEAIKIVAQLREVPKREIYF